MNELDELTKITQRTLQLNRQNNPESATRANPPPSWSYSDKRLFALEKRELFGRHPLLVGFSCDIAKPGDFFTLDDLDVPVLITRDSQGQANALLNICSHRAARLKEGAGNSRSISCPYHAWNFGLDGKLKKIFKEDSFGAVNKCDYNLQTLPCIEKYGMLFISLDAEAKLDIDQHLGDLGPWLQLWELEQTAFVDEHQWHAEGNWKHALDSLCRDYHGALLKGSSTPQTALETIADDDRFGPNRQHHRLTFASDALDTLRASDSEIWAAETLHNVRRVHFLFPNISLLISPLAVELFILYPGSEPHQHLIRYRCYRRLNPATADSVHDAQAHFEAMRELIVQHSQSRANDDANAGIGPMIDTQRACLAAIGVDPDSPTRPD